MGRYGCTYAVFLFLIVDGVCASEAFFHAASWISPHETFTQIISLCAQDTFVNSVLSRRCLTHHSNYHHVPHCVWYRVVVNGTESALRSHLRLIGAADDLLRPIAENSFSSLDPAGRPAKPVRQRAAKGHQEQKLHVPRTTSPPG